MQLSNTKTLQNLARSFAGEAQAGLRYQFAADVAQNQGYKVLSDEIRKIAKNEVNHAKVFFQFLTEDENRDNITFTAGFPYKGKTLGESLRFSIEGEKDEANVYEGFAEVAKLEGFTPIAEKFRMIAEIERRHADLFQMFSTGFENGTLYSAKTPLMWMCSECGHIETAKDGWNVCPVCGSTQGFIEIKTN